MKFLADQCLLGKTLIILRREGHQVVTLRELGKQSAPDDEVMKIADSIDAILITNDLDFGNIFLYPPSQYGGIIVLRIKPKKEDRVHTLLLDHLKSTNQIEICKTLIVIDHRTCRVHH